MTPNAIKNSTAKILTILFLGLLTAKSCYATEVGFILNKQVNGNWREKAIINYTFEKDKGAYPKAYLNTEAVFEAPRADITKPNHEWFGIVAGAKFMLPTNAILDISTSGRYMWKGNSEEAPEGLIIDLNTASITWQI